MRNDRQIIKFGPARYDSPKAIAKITEAKLNTEKTLLPYTPPTALPATDPDFTPTYPATEPESTTNYIPPAVNPPITSSIPNTTTPSGYNPGWTFYSGASPGIPFTVNITNVTWSKRSNGFNFFLTVRVTGFWFFLPYHAENAWSINGAFRLCDNFTIDSNGLLDSGQLIARTTIYNSLNGNTNYEQAWGTTKNFDLTASWFAGPSDFDINAIGVYSFDMITRPLRYDDMLNDTSGTGNNVVYTTMRYSDTVTGSNTTLTF